MPNSIIYSASITYKTENKETFTQVTYINISNPLNYDIMHVANAIMMWGSNILQNLGIHKAILHVKCDDTFEYSTDVYYDEHYHLLCEDQQNIAQIAAEGYEPHMFAFNYHLYSAILESKISPLCSEVVDRSFRVRC